jgi:hypothetical protein
MDSRYGIYLFTAKHAKGAKDLKRLRALRG